ncbi:hypothetical protein SteCoe_6491 [Stentor coeruleus]|uniref:SKP1 component POZ domain-containing protein n=1 Tax=Stentor coeruleus TaxID=5963 RepID=A0A1R2CPV0_9CILI|nr:hypothetical protein SteCoe_6491 [Stentor coeruleus]
MELTLISSEGTLHFFPIKIQDFSGFLAEIPDPNHPIDLSLLSINSETITQIQKFFEHYEVEIVTNSSNDMINIGIINRGNCEKSKDYSFVDELEIEQVLLLALAVHKLEIKPLQYLVYAKIANIVHCEEAEDAENKFEVQIMENEEVNKFICFEYKLDVKN